MKLLDILARELEEWPEGYSYIVQEGDGELYRSNDTRVSFSGFCTWDGDGDYFHPGLFVKLATDHATAIITREMWEEARAKLQEKKAMPKTNKDGWIRHRGGKCPVEKGTLIDVRYRDESFRSKISALDEYHKGEWCADPDYWRHDGIEGDIMAWRPHVADKPEKPAKVEIEEITPERIEAIRSRTRPSIADKPKFGPLQWRDRIHAIDFDKAAEEDRHHKTMDVLNKERQELVQRLEAEGLMLCQGKTASVEPKADMSDPEDWMEGGSDRMHGSRLG